MADLNRQDVIRSMMSQVDGLSYGMASASLEAVITAVTQALTQQKSVVFQEFGRFAVRQRQARQGVHPQTQRLVDIPAVPVPYFAPSPKLKKLVSGR